MREMRTSDRSLISALAVLIVLALLTSACTSSAIEFVQGEEEPMAINPHRGGDAQEIGKLVAKLIDRVQRLERRSRLTRVHPVTGSTDFVGTVYRTPSGQPTLVISEDGLEAPPTLAGSIRENYASTANTLVDDLNTWTDLVGPGEEPGLAVQTFTFIGVPANAIFIPLRAVVATAGGGSASPGSEDFQLEIRVKASHRDDDHLTTLTETQSPIYLAESNTGTNLQGQIDVQGTWRWEHGIPVTSRGFLVVEVTLKAVELPGQPLNLTLAEAPIGDLFPYLGGSGMDEHFRTDEPFRLNSELS